MLDEGLQRYLVIFVLILHIVTYNHSFNLSPWQTTSNNLSPWQATIAFLREVLQGPDDLTRDVPSSELRSEYDFIVIGAGSAGAVVANRLTEVPEWTVLLLEAGQDEIAITDIPFMSAVVCSTSYSWGYRAQPQDNACLGLKDRRSKWPKGKGVGGSSILNGMIYNRGHPRDYDNWEIMGNYGWGYKEVLHYFLKSENADGDFADSPFHSKGGYLDVQRVPHKTELVQAFFDTGAEFGYPFVDYNSDDVMGFSLIQATMKKGTRCSTNKAFLRPVRKRKNLHVAKFARVTKILINPTTRRAYGVEFYRNGKFSKAYVKKEVILSAGAINTPQLLMLSGVGDQQVLEKLKIPAIHHSPGVGLNLQDHIAFAGLSFLINQSVAITGPDLLSFSTVADYVARRDGLLTNIGVGEAIAFVRSEISKLPLDYPDLELMFGATHLGSDTSGIAQNHVGVTDEVFNTVYSPIGGRHGWSIFPIILQPESRGYVTITSSSPFKRPVMYSNYLDQEHDLNTIVEGIKMVIQLSKSKAFQKYDTKLHTIPYPQCRGITFGSDEYWRCATRVLTTTVHHQCCTTKMGPRSDPWAVVDPELRVFGILGLRVVDASIMPVIPAAHTNAACIMIGEKAADMIKIAWEKR